MGRKLTNITPEKRKELFLAQLRREPNITKAAKAAGYARRYMYALRDEDPDFARAWDEALDESLDAAEGELYRRAIKGVLKPVYQGGKKVGTVREFSDTLLIFYLKTIGKKRGYIERHEVTGADGAPIQIEYVNDWRNAD